MFQGNLYYHITIPGREIPKWFGHQSKGTSLNLQVPSDKLKGIALCAVFVLRHHPPLHQILSDAEIFGEYIFTHRLSWYLKANGEAVRDSKAFLFQNNLVRLNCIIFTWITIAIDPTLRK